MSDKPYKEYQEDGYFFREFSPDVDEEELKWHRDYEDRYVTVLNENDWKYQEDNKLPQDLIGTIFIPKGKWHRVIKGKTKLLVKILKVV